VRNVSWADLWASESQQLIADLKRDRGRVMFTMHRTEDQAEREALVKEMDGLDALLRVAQIDYDEAVAVAGHPDHLPVRT